MNGYTGQNGQQPVYAQPQARPVTPYNYPYNELPVEDIIADNEPALEMTVDYSAHREGEYDRYPDFPGYANNNMYHP